MHPTPKAKNENSECAELLRSNDEPISWKSYTDTAASKQLMPKRETAKSRSMANAAFGKAF